MIDTQIHKYTNIIDLLLLIRTIKGSLLFHDVRTGFGSLVLPVVVYYCRDTEKT